MHCVACVLQVGTRTFYFVAPDDVTAYAWRLALNEAKVRKGGGKVGTRTEVPASVRKLLDDKWRDTLAGPTGCATYDELRAAIKAESALSQ